MRAAVRRLILLAWLICAAQALAAQAQARANHIHAQLLAEGPAAPGERLMLALLMTPEPGWHGYWSNPGDAGYGLELSWSLPPGWEAGKPEYPVPQTLLVQGLMNHVFEGQYAVLVPLSVPAGVSSGTRVPIGVQAQWLACTREICVPERATLAASLVVGGNGVADPRFDRWRSAIPALIDRRGSFALAADRLRIAIPLPASLPVDRPHLFIDNRELVDYAAPQAYRRDGDLLIAELRLRSTSVLPPVSVSGVLGLDDAGNGVRFEADSGNVPEGGTPLRPAAADAGHVPLGLLLALALAGGVLLNIMPCVFPILSLKALSLARAGESAAEARREGLAYTGGVVLACLALGALMLALRAAGAEIGWAFQLQEPGVVAGLLLLAAAITANFAGLFELPALSITSERPIGAFATGLLAAFVATPCTGPFMAAAMGAALLLPAAQALLLFAALGLGIALPFLLLGFIAPLRRMLPRPGAWMMRFRRIMAVPMGLTALALLWLCWRLGGIGFMLASGALALALIVLLAFIGARQRGGAATRPLVLAGLPALALLAILALPAAHAPATGNAGGVIPARDFSEAELARARASGHPVFVWFTADWCLTCKVNESVAIEREETREAFARAGVIAIRGDWTRRDPAITRFLNRHGAAGVPLYLWYPPGGEAQQLPQVLAPGSLVTLAREG